MYSKRTKIVATIGPASWAPETLERLISSGVNVVRLNFSHGTAEDHRTTAQNVRAIADRLGRTVSILQDLQGPKIRVGRFASRKVELAHGQAFTITTDDVMGDTTRVSSAYKGLPGDVAPGQELLLDDGKLRLRVTGTTATEVHTTVEVGGPLSDHKGINIPGADLSIPALTEKDIADLAVGEQLEVDWVAVSFVRTRDDVLLARDHLNKLGSNARLIAKIEKPGAVQRFAEILEVVDGIMVARGDLGVEMCPEDVPVIQKRIIELCRAAGKPVITATQMLESMVVSPRPTRAEASDVANAIFDGTDAVMLSAETASGMYPVESVEMMRRVAVSVERSPEFVERLINMCPPPLHNTQDAIAKSAVDVARQLDAAAIVTFTVSGTSAWRIARNRPRVPVLALTPDLRVRNLLSLAFGVFPKLTSEAKDTDDMVRIALEEARRTGIARFGDRVVIVAGVPLGVRGTTNLLRVERLREPRV
jgi:pyruvate kinase